MRPFTHWYRIKRWCWRYVRFRDAAQLLMAGAAGLLAINTYSKNAVLTVAAGMTYFVLLLLSGVTVLRNRKARDHIQAEVLWELFHHMNNELFESSDTARFTFFNTTRFSREECLVPWYRYRKGAQDPIEEANRSRAKYKRGEGITGQAWSKTGRLLFGTYPAFATRQDFERHYIDVLGIDRETVQRLSGEMQHVRTIFCYGFTNGSGKLIGVLSLDLEDGLQVDPETNILKAEFVTSQKMAVILRTIEAVLRSFDTMKKEIL
jgi:hypothetical protein